MFYVHRVMLKVRHPSHALHPRYDCIASSAEVIRAAEIAIFDTCSSSVKGVTGPGLLTGMIFGDFGFRMFVKKAMEGYEKLFCRLPGLDDGADKDSGEIGMLLDVGTAVRIGE